MLNKSPDQVYLLNEKAYSIVTGQSAKELFKDKALKQYTLSEKQLKDLNPQNTNDPEKAKVFFYDAIGMARVYFNGPSKVTDWNKHLSKDAYITGARASGYLN